VSWLLWLSAPVVAGAGTAVWAWWSGWRERPHRAPSTARAVRAHDRYLEALDRARPNA
jgi:hypothetical protein